MSEFDGKAVIVTGGTRGIGRAVAEQFAALGAKVAVVGTSEAKAKAVAEEIGAGALGIGANVSVYEDCAAMVEKTVSAFGRLDVLVNNAGISGERAPVADQALDNWANVINVNLNGVFYCSKAAIPAMRKCGGGAIVNVSSVEGLIAATGLSPYVSSKHAVIGLTKNIALEYGKDNIRCNSIAPGFIATDMTSDGFSEQERTMIAAMTAFQRPASPTEVANLICWLASDKATYITGSCHVVDGGMTSGISL